MGVESASTGGSPSPGKLGDFRSTKDHAPGGPPLTEVGSAGAAPAKRSSQLPTYSSLWVISSEFKRQLAGADSREIEAGGREYMHDLLGERLRAAHPQFTLKQPLLTFEARSGRGRTFS